MAKTMTEAHIKKMTAGNLLDDLVHHFKSKEASNLDNSGAQAQLEYIKSCGMSDEQILDALGMDVQS